MTCALVLFGWCATATYYLEALYAHGLVPVRVVTGTNAPGQAPLASRCAPKGVPVERVDDVNDPDFVQRLLAAAPDLILVAGWPRLFKPPVLRSARLGALNLHPSLLPEYRGKHPLFWAILNGERRVGITVHHMTEQIDAGPILLQRVVDVLPGATSESLAHAVDSAGAELIPEILEMAERRVLPPGTKPDAPGSYFPPVGPEHALVDFARPAPELERLLLACWGTIQPYTFYRGMKLVPLAAEVAAEPSARAPGTILRIDANGITIATSPGSPAIKVARWLFLDREHDALGIARALGLDVGSHFSPSP